MISFEIGEIKKTMGRMLLGSDFDAFLLVDALIVAANTYSIDGRINESFYNRTEDPEESGDNVRNTVDKVSYSSWCELKPYVLSVIKGKISPLRFKMVFCIKPDMYSEIFEMTDAAGQEADIASLNFTLLFERGSKETPDRMICSSGMARRSFTMDKSAERAWDSWVEQFMDSE